MKNLNTYLNEGFFKNVGGDVEDRIKWLKKFKRYMAEIYEYTIKYEAGGIKKNFIFNIEPEKLLISFKDASLKTDKSNYIIDLSDDRIWSKFKDYEFDNDTDVEIYLISGSHKTLRLYIINYTISPVNGIKINFDYKTKEIEL